MRFQLGLGNFVQMSGDYLVTFEKLLTQLSKTDILVFIDIQNDQQNERIDHSIQKLKDAGFFKEVASEQAANGRNAPNGPYLKSCVVKCQPEQQQILFQSKDAYRKLIDFITNSFQIDSDPVISPMDTQSLRIQVNYENINDVRKKVDEFIKSIQFTQIKEVSISVDKYMSIFQKSDVQVIKLNQNQEKKQQPLKGYKTSYIEELEQYLLYGFNEKVRSIQNIIEQTIKIGFFNIYNTLYLPQTLERLQRCYIYGEPQNNVELLLIGPQIEVKEQGDLIRRDVKTFRLKLNTELKNKYTEQEFKTLNFNEFINSQAELQFDENNQQFFTYMACIYIEIDDRKIINDIYHCSTDKRDIHNSMEQFLMDEAEKVMEQPGIKNALLFLLLTNSLSQEESMMKEFRVSSTLEIQKLYEQKLLDFIHQQDFDFIEQLQEENEVIIDITNKVLSIKGKLDKVNRATNFIKQYYESQQEDVNYFDFESDLHVRIIDKYFDERFQAIFDNNYCKYRKKKLERRLEIRGGIRNVNHVIKELTQLDKKIGNDLLEIQELIDRKEMQREIYKKIIEDIQNKTATQIIEGESENQHMICFLEYQCDKIQIKLSQGNPILSIKDSKDHQKYQNTTIVIPIQRGQTYKRTWESDLMELVQNDNTQSLIKQYGIQYKIADNSEAPKSKNQLKKQPKKEPIIIALKILNIFHQDETQHINYFDKETIERGFEQGFQQLFNDANSENGSKRFIISMIDDERLDLQIIKIFQKILDSNKRDKKIQFEFLVHSLDNLYTLANILNKQGMQRKEYKQQIHSIQNITIRGLYEEDLNEALEELRQKC